MQEDNNIPVNFTDFKRITNEFKSLSDEKLENILIKSTMKGYTVQFDDLILEDLTKVYTNLLRIEENTDFGQVEDDIFTGDISNGSDYKESIGDEKTADSDNSKADENLQMIYVNEADILTLLGEVIRKHVHRTAVQNFKRFIHSIPNSSKFTNEFCILRLKSLI